MSEDAVKRAAYEAKRRVDTGLPSLPPQTVTRPLRIIGQPDMEHPPSITYRADMARDVWERMRAAGFEFADKAPAVGNFM